MPKTKIFIIAGEVSGDLHGSNLLKELNKLMPGTVFSGWGGDRMEKEGMTIQKHIKELSFMGFLEVLLNLSTILRNIKHCKLQSTLGVCRANLFKYIRANRVVKFNFRVTFVLLVLIHLRCSMFYFFNRTASRYIGFNGNKF